MGLSRRLFCTVFSVSWFFIESFLSFIYSCFLLNLTVDKILYMVKNTYKILYAATHSVDCGADREFFQKWRHHAFFLVEFWEVE